MERLYCPETTVMTACPSLTSAWNWAMVVWLVAMTSAPSGTGSPLTSFTVTVMVLVVGETWNPVLFPG